MLISIVLPIFNEVQIITDTVNSIYSYFSIKYGQGNFEILLVDDGSTDGTRDVLNKLSKALPYTRVIGFNSNRGKGAAVRSGMLEANGDFVLFTDCDLAYGVETIGNFVDTYYSSTVDVVIGSRYLSNNGIKKYPLIRKVVSATFIKLARHYAGLTYSDSQCGIKGFSKEAARLVFSKCQMDGWAFDLEILLLCQKSALRVFELPVEILNHQDTKVSLLGDTIEIIADLPKIKKSINKHI